MLNIYLTTTVRLAGLISRSISNKPPKHYTMKILSFSALKSENRYESGEFKVGGYKW